MNECMNNIKEEENTREKPLMALCPPQSRAQGSVKDLVKIISPVGGGSLRRGGDREWKRERGKGPSRASMEL